MTTTHTTTDTQQTARPRAQTRTRRPGQTPTARPGPSEANSRPVPRPSPRPAADDPGLGVNEVRLVGRVTSVPVVVDLPSGDALVSFRVSVPRSPGMAKPGGTTSGQRVDSIPCSAWTGALRRRIAGWRPGDTVEISGVVCCRFYQAGGATRSRVEVVASSAKIIRRAPAA